MPPVVRNILMIVGSLFALGKLRNKARQQKQDQQLWSQATDDVQPGDNNAGGTPPAV